MKTPRILLASKHSLNADLTCLLTSAEFCGLAGGLRSCDGLIREAAVFSIPVRADTLSRIPAVPLPSCLPGEMPMRDCNAPRRRVAEAAALPQTPLPPFGYGRLAAIQARGRCALRRISDSGLPDREKYWLRHQCRFFGSGRAPVALARRPNEDQG